MDDPITERQLAFAMCLGIPLPAGTTFEQLRLEIDRYLNAKASTPPSSIQRVVAENWGERISWNTTCQTLSKRLWEVYVEVGTDFVSDVNQRSVYGYVVESFTDGQGIGRATAQERTINGHLGCLAVSLVLGVVLLAIVVVLMIF